MLKELTKTMDKEQKETRKIISEQNENINKDKEITEKLNKNARVKKYNK